MTHIVVCPIQIPNGPISMAEAQGLLQFILQDNTVYSPGTTLIIKHPESENVIFFTLSVDQLNALCDDSNIARALRSKNIECIKLLSIHSNTEYDIWPV